MAIQSLLPLSNQLARWRIAGWGLAALLLLAPAVAMQFTREVNWRPGDFVVAAGLIGVTGIGLELVARAQLGTARRLAIAGAVLAVPLIVWAELAVGIF